MSRQAVSLSISITDISCIRVHLFHIFKAFPYLYFFLIKALFLKNGNGTLKTVTSSQLGGEHLPATTVAWLRFLNGGYDGKVLAFYKLSHVPT